MPGFTLRRCYLVGRGRQTEQVGEVHAGRKPGDGSERRRQVQVRGREVADRRDLAARLPVDPALTSNRAVDQRDDAFGEPCQLIRLEVRPEGDPWHIEHRMAGPARQLMLDAHLGHFRPLPGKRRIPLART